MVGVSVEQSIKPDVHITRLHSRLISSMHFTVIRRVVGAPRRQSGYNPDLAFCTYLLPALIDRR
jgi:hypothetical protein